jgi:hypothetical protein
MLEMAISVLWFLIGLIVLAGIIYLAIWVIETFIFPIPEMIKKGVWVIVLLLALIALLTVLVGGGGRMRLPWSHGESQFPAIGGAVPPPPAIMVC